MAMKSLICACCGASIRGWQHWDRDQGYGICRGCEKDYGYHTEGIKPMKNLQTLNALSSELARLAFDSEGEINLEMEMFTARIEGKVDAYGWLLDDIPHRIAAVKERIDALTNVKKRWEGIESALMWKLKMAMSTLNVNEIAGEQYKFKYVGCKKAVEVFNTDTVPEKYLKIISQIDSSAIRADLDQGIDVPGARFTGGTYLKKSLV